MSPVSRLALSLRKKDSLILITPDTGDFTPPRKKKSVNKTDSTKKVKKVITKKRAFNEDEYEDGN